MRHLKKAVVISVISIFLLSGTIPAFCQLTEPTHTHTPITPTVDGQRFCPETPQQRINKANDDAVRYQQQVPPPGGNKKKAKPASPAPPPSAP